MRLLSALFACSIHFVFTIAVFIRIRVCDNEIELRLESAIAAVHAHTAHTHTDFKRGGLMQQFYGYSYDTDE